MLDGIVVELVVEGAEGATNDGAGRVKIVLVMDRSVKRCNRLDDRRKISSELRERERERERESLVRYMSWIEGMTSVHAGFRAYQSTPARLE